MAVCINVKALGPISHMIHSLSWDIINHKVLSDPDVNIRGIPLSTDVAPARAPCSWLCYLSHFPNYSQKKVSRRRSTSFSCWCTYACRCLSHKTMPFSFKCSRKATQNLLVHAVLRRAPKACATYMPVSRRNELPSRLEEDDNSCPSLDLSGNNNRRPTMVGPGHFLLSFLFHTC